LLSESRLVIPAWLQVVGRMHPLILHFPIALLILFIAQRLILKQADNTLLLLAAFTAAITATMGLLLSKEPGYDPDTLQVHKYSGILISLTALAWYTWYDRLEAIRYAPAITAIISLTALTIAGEKGAGITHGDNFLLAPVSPNNPKKAVSFDEAVVFNDMVQPILKAKCMGCHNTSKAKGELVMETLPLLLKGGKSGPLWDSSKADFGGMMARIHMSPDEEKHMPPRGKPQLTDAEMTILYQWLKHDPSRSIKVSELPAKDTLRQLALTLFKKVDEDTYDFDPADEKTVEKLNTSYRVIYPVALHSPALNVDFYSPQFFKSDQLKDLEPLGKQIVSLDLDKMPVTDADIPAILHFTNLRTLNLSFTGVTGAGIAQLCKLEKLKSLSLSGTAIKADDIACLISQKSLRHLYIWNTAIPPGSILLTRNSNLVIEGGSRMDTVLLKLNPPILGDNEPIVMAPETLTLKHYVPGTVIRYTLDGSDPDSTRSIVYNKNILVSQMSVLKAKAFKKGWLPSDATLNYFYSEKYRPDSIRMLKPIDSNYMRYGGKTLIDLVKGDENFYNGKWLGFRKNNMECLLFFHKPVLASQITLSGLVNTGASIMPPAKIEVWGGVDAQNMRLLAHLEPEQPKTPPPVYLTPYDLLFSPTSVRCLKISVAPVAKLPDWQLEKGKKGWVFIDEIFVN
jgi:hypothetical protein